MKVTSTVSVFVLQSLARGGGWEVRVLFLPAFPSEIHLHPRRIMVYPGKIIKEGSTSHTYPTFWLSPKCKVLLIIKPKSIFNLPDNGNCFHERMSDSIRFPEVAGDWEW